MKENKMNLSNESNDVENTSIINEDLIKSNQYNIINSKSNSYQY